MLFTVETLVAQSTNVRFYVFVRALMTFPRTTPREYLAACDAVVQFGLVFGEIVSTFTLIEFEAFAAQRTRERAFVDDVATMCDDDGALFVVAISICGLGK